MEAEPAIASSVVSSDSAIGGPLQAAPLTGMAARRLQAALCFAAFLVSLNFFAPTPFYPQMAHDLDTTVPLLGQVVTLMALLSAGLGLIAGPLADRYGFRWPLVAGLLALAVAMAGTGLAPGYPVLLTLGALGGFGDALGFSLPFAIAATLFNGDERRRTISWTIAALSMPPIIGVPILTAIGSASSWRVALVIAGLAALVAACWIAAVLPADRRQTAARFHPRTLLTAYVPLLHHPPSLRLLAVSALRGIWWIGLLTYLGAFLGTVVGFDPRQVGLAYALTGITYAAGSVATGSRFGAISPRLMVAASCLLGGAVVGPLLIFPGSALFVPLLALGSLAAAVCSVGIVNTLVSESPAGAATTMVLNSAMLNGGTALGAVAGGVLIAAGGYTALGIGLPGFALLSAILAAWPARRDATAREA